MSSNSDNKIIHIHEWQFDPIAKTLRRINDGRTVKLEDKISKLLHTFCEHRGAIISKDEIIKKVWDGRELSEQTIPVAISKLRKALGDDINQPQMLETLPRQGYRLLDDTAVHLGTKAHISPIWKRNGIIIATALALIVTVTGLGLYITKTSTPLVDRIQFVNAEKPGVIITINDVRTTDATESDIDQAIGISELSSYFLAQVPDILVIRHWWNLDAPDPTGGIYTRYGNTTPVYSLKATLLKDSAPDNSGNIVTFILSEPKTDEVLWTGLHKVSNGSTGLFTILDSMLGRLSVGQGITAAAAPEEDMRYWNARYFMQLSNAGAAQKAYNFIQTLASEKPYSDAVKPMKTALVARWKDSLPISNTGDLAAPLQTSSASSGLEVPSALVDAAAIALYRDNDASAAIELLEQAFQKAPGDHYAYSLWAEAKERKGERAEAIKAYRKAIRLAPYARAYGARLQELETSE